MVCDHVPYHKSMSKQNGQDLCMTQEFSEIHICTLFERG